LLEADEEDEEDEEGGTCFGGSAPEEGFFAPSAPAPPPFPFFVLPASASSIHPLIVLAFRRSCAAPWRTSRRMR